MESILYHMINNNTTYEQNLLGDNSIPGMICRESSFYRMMDAYRAYQAFETKPQCWIPESTDELPWVSIKFTHDAKIAKAAYMRINNTENAVSSVVIEGSNINGIWEDISEIDIPRGNYNEVVELVNDMSYIEYRFTFIRNSDKSILVDMIDLYNDYNQEMENMICNCKPIDTSFIDSLFKDEEGMEEPRTLLGTFVVNKNNNSFDLKRTLVVSQLYIVDEDNIIWNHYSNDYTLEGSIITFNIILPYDLIIKVYKN